MEKSQKTRILFTNMSRVRMFVGMSTGRKHGGLEDANFRKSFSRKRVHYDGAVTFSSGNRNNKTTSGLARAILACNGARAKRGARPSGKSGDNIH